MSRRAKIVISDTHVGAGGYAEGNMLEDFTSDAEFVDWLHGLVDESNRDGIEMELIINGDFIEFLQIPSVDPFEPHRRYETATYVDVRAEAALQRLEITYEWHPSIYLGLADFINPGPPRRAITILYGNHDPELVYPAVAARLGEMLNAVGDDAGLLSFGPRSYFSDGVYIEHGNAYVEEINRFSDPDAPFDPGNPDLIERPAGSKFVTRFFNEVEWEHPWVDGVHPITALIFYALAFKPALAVKALKAFLLAAPDIFLQPAAEPGAPRSTSQALLDQIDTPDREQAVAARLQTDPEFRSDFQRQVEQALIEVGAMPGPPEGVAAATLSPAQRARQISEHYWHVLEETAERIAVEQGAQVVLFGHIHALIEKRLPSGALYLNTGAWVWQGDFSEESDEVWQDLLENPDKYMHTRDLAFARIDFDAGGQLVAARLGRVSEPSPPPEPAPPQPRPGLWPRLVLLIRGLFDWLLRR